MPWAILPDSGISVARSRNFFNSTSKDKGENSDEIIGPGRLKVVTWMQVLQGLWMRCWYFKTTSRSFAPSRFIPRIS